MSLSVRPFARWRSLPLRASRSAVHFALTLRPAIAPGTRHNREEPPTTATSVPVAAEIEQLWARVAELEARQREAETRPVQRSA